MELLSSGDIGTTGTCEFRCLHDGTCLPRSSQVCDGRADCADSSDELKCPRSAALLQSQPSVPNRNQQTQPPYGDLMQEVSGVQICIVAAALMLALGLITCVVNHYNKMGGRTWSGDQRKDDHSRRTNSATTNLALYSPSKAREHARKEMLLYQEHQLRMLSVHRDIALNLPSTVRRPDREDNLRQPLNVKAGGEVPRAYLQPPPNRTIAPSNFSKRPSPKVRQHSTHSTARDYDLVTHPSVHRSAKKNSPSFLVRVCDKLELWHPPRIQQEDICTIAIFNDTMRDLDSDDPPPKYEDVVQQSILPTKLQFRG